MQGKGAATSDSQFNIDRDNAADQARMDSDFQGDDLRIDLFDVRAQIQYGSPSPKIR
jgi:hypothetical protein